MDLITCPLCGKHVSDTAERCVHCGTSLKSECMTEMSTNNSAPEQKRFYDDLSQTEMDEILEEYYAVNPECKKHNKIVKAVNIAEWVCIGIGIIGAIVWIILWGLHNLASVEFPSIVIVLFIPLIIISIMCLIASGILGFVIKSLNKKTSAIDVEFKKWLREEKNLDWSYNVDVSAK